MPDHAPTPYPPRQKSSKYIQPPHSKTIPRNIAPGQYQPRNVTPEHKEPRNIAPGQYEPRPHTSGLQNNKPNNMPRNQASKPFSKETQEKNMYWTNNYDIGGYKSPMQILNDDELNGIRPEIIEKIKLAEAALTTLQTTRDIDLLKREYENICFTMPLPHPNEERLKKIKYAISTMNLHSPQKMWPIFTFRSILTKRILDIFKNMSDLTFAERQLSFCVIVGSTPVGAGGSVMFEHIRQSAISLIAPPIQNRRSRATDLSILIQVWICYFSLFQSNVFQFNPELYFRVRYHAEAQTRVTIGAISIILNTNLQLLLEPNNDLIEITTEEGALANMVMFLQTLNIPINLRTCKSFIEFLFINATDAIKLDGLPKPFNKTNSLVDSGTSKLFFPGTYVNINTDFGPKCGFVIRQDDALLEVIYTDDNKTFMSDFVRTDTVNRMPQIVNSSSDIYTIKLQ